jgi:fibronectin-binding autotransporter adhesin
MNLRLRYLCAVAVATLLSFETLAQTTGDYQSNAASFSWTATASWQRWNGASWVTNPTEGYPGQNVSGVAGTVTILNGHSVTLNVSPAQSIGNLVVGGGTSGTLTVNNNTTGRTLTMTGSVTVNSGATVQTGNTGVHTLNVAGNITNNGTFNLTSGSNLTSVLNLNGSSAQTISGNTLTINNLTLASSTGNNVNTNASISINNNGVLNFTSTTNRLLVVGTSANVTLSTGATISNYGTGSYIQTDGLSGSNSNLIKTTAAQVTGNTSWDMVFPIGTSSGGYTPVDLPTIATTPVANATLSVKAIYQSSNQGQLRRIYRFVVSANANATTFSSGVFKYVQGTDVSSGDDETNYTTGWYLTIPSGSWTSTAITNTFASDQWTITSASLQTGTYYHTIGTSTAYPNTWYTYQTGVWSNYLNWTLDPSGTTSNNPLSLPPVPGDQIVILNGYTITNDVSGQVASTTTINNGGTLDMSNTTGNTLGTVSGDGLLRIKGPDLPDGTYTSFVSTSGGTIEYYDTGGTLTGSETTTYNNLMMTNSTGSDVTFITASNLTVNGTFNISRTGAGFTKWQINDVSNAQRTISLLGDLTVGSGCQIGVGTGNEASTTPHALTMAANITNNGTIKFFDETDTEIDVANYGLNTANFYTNEQQGNAVNVTYSNTGDNTIDCLGVTDFYRLLVNKGTGPGAILSITSSSAANCRVFGPVNDMARPSISLQNGTLKLNGTMNIGYLVLSNEDYYIPSSAGLWLNGNGVTVTATDNSAKGGFNYNTFLDGILRITDGTYNGGSAPGLIAGDEGTLIMEGGTLNVWQLRGENPSSGNFNYSQSGGTVNVAYGFALDYANNSGSYARFALGSSTATFQMTGGTLNVAKATSDGGFVLGSGSGYYTVTGGTVNLYMGPQRTNSDQTFTINSTSSFYDLNIFRESPQVTTTVAQLLTNGLTVVNNLTIDNSTSTQTPTLNCNNLNVKIGGNFNIQSGTTFTPGTDTVTFNGSGAQTWTYSGTITSLNHVVVNKSAGILTLSAPSTTFPNITGGLTITAGTLADGGETLTITGSVLSNSGTISGSGVIVVDATATVTSIGGNNGTFLNLTINDNTGSTGYTVDGNQTITGILRLINNTQCNLNIGANSLTVLGAIYSDATTATSFSSTKRIITNGQPNAGGLTRQATSGSDVLFPIGTATAGRLYTSVTINATATTAGTITLRNVDSEHPNVTTSGQSVQYYWRVSSSGFAGLGAVTHKIYNYSSATESGTLTSYRAARFDASTLTWAYNNTTFDASSVNVIPNFSTGSGWTGIAADVIDGEYTCGDVSGFGAFATYYSRLSGAWNVNSTWSTASVGGVAASSNPTNCTNCPVIIGDGSNNHTITIDANNRLSGSLALASGSTLDCATFSGLDFGTINNINGYGTLRVSSSTFPNGDFTNFVGSSGGTVEWYGGTKTLPTSNSDGISLATYYNLKFSPDAAADITLPATNLTIYNNLTVTGVNSTTSRVLNNTATATNRTITINGALTITTGKFYINSGARLNFNVSGLTTVGASGFFQLDATGTKTHTFTTSSGISNSNSTAAALDFNGGTNIMNLSLTGSSDVSLTGPGSADFNLITVNKGTDSTATVKMDMLTVTAPSTAWLTLTNGTFHFANAGTYSLRTSGNFTIGATTRLQVSSGTVNIISAGTGNLNLSGALEISGGTVNVVSGTNGNDIEYSSTGLPVITVSGGNLFVNGQIRRSTTTTLGSLTYNQTGGSVTVHGYSPSVTRGIFEIDNTGSSFTLTGTSTLTIERGSGGISYADLFLNPDASNVSSTSNIVLSTTALTSNIRVDVEPSLGNLTVAGTTSKTVTMQNNPLVLQGSLTISTPATLVTSSLDVTIGENLSCTGTYTGGTNTTTFTGSADNTAQLSGTSTFTNFTINKSASNTLTLSGTSPTLTNLNILQGILDVGSLDLAVNGNIVNNSTEIASGNGDIIMSSSAASHTITSSGGSFTHLKLAPDAGAPTTKTITVSGDLTMNGILDFNTTSTNVYFFIGSSLLTLSSSSTVINAGANRFIKTNGVSSDAGVLRNWPIGTATFTYDLGTRVNYTPVTFTNTPVTTAGTITVIPVDDQHPTQESGSSLQLLSYYWIVKKGSSLVDYTINTKPGTITTSTASTTVTGSSANFTGQLVVGQYIYTTGGVLIGTVASITSNSSLELTSAATINLTSQAYRTRSSSGSVAFQAPTLLIAGSGGTLNGAYLDVSNLNGANGWATAGVVTQPSSNTVATFTNTATNIYVPSTSGQFDYTIGDPSRLPSPIAFVYSRESDNGGGNPSNVNNLNVGGNWSDPNSWTLESDGTGAPLGSAPTNKPVSILSGHRINMSINGHTSFVANLYGLLVVNGTVAHNIGNIFGTGTLRTSTSTLPAGTYSNFVAKTGGTIEYTNTMTMNNRSEYNNLSIRSGTATTGTLTVANGSMTVAGTGTAFTTELSVGQGLYTSGGTWIGNVASITDNITLTLAANTSSAFTGVAFFIGGAVNATISMTNTDLTLNGDLTITSGSTLTNPSDFDINIAGDWTNNGTYNQGTEVITFDDATDDQSINGTTTFGNLAIDKAAGTVTLAGTGATNVSTSLTLTSGHVISSSTNELALGTSTVTTTSVLGGSGTSFIAGPVTKTIAAGSSFEAPLGRVLEDQYRPATILNTTGSTGWRFEYKGTGPLGGTAPCPCDNEVMTLPLRSVSAFEYWVIGRTGVVDVVNDRADVTLSYDVGSYSPPGITTPGALTDLRVARWTGTSWALPPNSGGANAQISGNSVSGTIKATNITQFSPLTNASVVDNSPLPVELLYFTGRLTPKGVQLDWKTATEIDNDYFTIEKSVNGEKFSSLTQVDGAGTSYTPKQYQHLDTKLYYGTMYYRLKQTDFNGKSETFKVISIDYRGDDQVFLSVYPNPAAGGELNIEIGGLKEVSSLAVTVTDQLGRTVLTGELEIDPVGSIVTRKLSTESLSSGVYFIKMGAYVRRIVISK